MPPDPKNHIDIELSADKTKLTLTIPTTPPLKWTMEAEQVDSIVEALILWRNGMIPEIPQTDLEVGNRAQFALNGRWHVCVPKKDTLGLSVLLPGQRWRGMLFDEHGAKTLQTELGKQIEKAWPPK